MERNADKTKECKKLYSKRCRINELGKEVFSISKKEDAAVWQAKWSELYLLAADVFCPSHVAVQKQEYFHAILIDVLTKYDPKKSPLSAYIQKKMEWLEIDDVRKRSGQRVIRNTDEGQEEREKPKKERIRTMISYDGTAGGKDDDAASAIKDNLADKHNAITDIEIDGTIDFYLIDLISQILNFANKNPKNKREKKLRKCYEIFYTSGIINHMKMSNEDPDYFQLMNGKNRIQHTRDMVQAMVFPFIPFCMEDMNRLKAGDIEISFEQNSYTYKISRLDKLTQKELQSILKAISDGNMKKYGQVVKEKEPGSDNKDSKTAGVHKTNKCDPLKPIPIPMPRKVGYCFYNVTSEENDRIAYTSYLAYYNTYKKEFLAKFPEMEL